MPRIPVIHDVTAHQLAQMLKQAHEHPGGPVQYALDTGAAFETSTESDELAFRQFWLDVAWELRRS